MGDPVGPARDSRGLANVLLGRTDHAIEDFVAFLQWVDTSVKESCRKYYRPSRESWIRTLQSADNPFDVETLRDLRVRPTTAGASPC